jgi:TRAP transporter TAXI family solute receptor
MRRIGRGRRGLLAAVVAGALALAGCGGERGGGGRLSIATGNTSGVYYQLGGGLARLVGEHLPGYEATAEATSASVENIQRVVRGDSDLAFTLADSAADAVNGSGAFSSPQPLRALARLYDNHTQVAARAGSGIGSVADMKGKRVSTGSPNSGTEVIALRLLQAAGLDPDKDVERQALGLTETVQGMKDGTIDAMFWSGGLPTSGVTDLTSSLKGKVAFVPLADLLPELQRRHGPVYARGTIPADVYKQPADVATISVANLLIVNQGMSDRLAADLARLLFEHKAELEKVHPAAKGISRDSAGETAPVRLHPGAEGYLREGR